MWWRSLIVNITFHLWTGAALVLCVPLLAAPASWVEAGQRFWARGVFAMLRFICGIDYDIRGRERLPGGPYIAAVKHQSAWDTVIVHLLFESPAVVLKRELMFIPVYGWFAIKTGHIPIDRSAGGRSLRRIIRTAKKRAQENRPIIIFPEGTRVAPDQQKPYLPGIAGVYSQLDLPVYPVALNSGLFWPRRSFLRRPGRIIVEVLPPIEPGLSRDEFMSRLRHDIEGASARLAAEARRARRQSDVCG